METKKKFEGKHSELTAKILGAFFQLHKEIGFGFSEKIYEAALELLLLELVVQRDFALLRDFDSYYEILRFTLVGEL